ncbi:MAG: hypothetical protein QME83_13135 [Thermodesulfobacteriota bacterium]|nr:hypothetical protein [Thermodesulfobacteriota bacterium]
MKQFTFLILILILLFPIIALSQKSDPIIVDFKIQALYRAAKLTWKVKEGLKDKMTVQIFRADTFEDGPYKEVDAVPLAPDKNAYEYIDKTMGAESKYYYKLIIKETNESFGPIPTRPFFSPPATHWKPPAQKQQQGNLLGSDAHPPTRNES